MIFVFDIIFRFFRFFFRATRLGTAARGSDIHVAARNGDFPALRHFLRVAPEKVHEKDEYGRFPQELLFFLRLRGWKVGSVPTVSTVSSLVLKEMNLLDFCCI